MITSSQSETKELHGQLDVLVTKYNHQIMRRHLRNPRVYYNPFALGLYLKAVDLVIADVNSTSAKAEAARKIGIKLINEEGLLGLQL